ncbi:hypothetical protein ACFY00_33110 [Kitasatospora sp. NPDC001540]|uniref:hypothetical protein n=1 Tax=Kitasatospora sp. NPDC001540 TaxID=3364014 RepID=UPI0036A44140
MLAEEQLLAVPHDGIRTIRRSAGTCPADDLAAHLIQQMRGGLLHEAAALGEGSAGTADLDVEALASRSYTVETSIGGRSARVAFTAGLADSGIAHGEHLDIRATVSLRYRVDLTLRFGLVSTDAGASWALALAKAERRWLASARQMTDAAGPHITQLVHDPRHRAGLAPVIDTARHVAAVRALFELQRARDQLAWAASRAVSAREIFNRYGCTEPDLARLRVHLGHLARLASEGRCLVGW